MCVAVIAEFHAIVIGGKVDVAVTIGLHPATQYLLVDLDTIVQGLFGIARVNHEQPGGVAHVMIALVNLEGHNQNRRRIT